MKRGRESLPTPSLEASMACRATRLLLRQLIQERLPRQSKYKKTSLQNSIQVMLMAAKKEEKNMPQVYQEELARLAYEAQGYNDQSRALQQQLAALQAAIADIRGAIETLQNLEKATQGILAPIGAGVMMKAKLVNEGKVLVDIGSGFIAEKEIAEGLKILHERLKRTEEGADQTQKGIAQIAEHLSEIDSRAKIIIDKSKGAGGK
ncbi:prefoldin subunit alpha [Candidatus Micrarchaeota archaeon]|nr:MAG: prefoldin subunit alpha [Candidatus Micrarchaeota archaeon]